MSARKVRSVGSDLLLLAAIGGLLLLLLWPALEAWLNRPRSGKQVCQQCLVQEMPVDYLLYLPPKYDAERKWPLVVYLHGAGARGADLNLVRRDGLPRQVDRGKQLDFVLLSPQCPAESRWDPVLVVGLIDHISSSLSVDRDRVCLTGYSMGGFGTWETASFDPSRFAAIAPLAGGGNTSRAGRLTMPIWAFHGEKDEVVLLEASRAMIDAVRACGRSAQLTVLAGQGHGICDEAYQDELFRWLLAQRRGQTSRHDAPAEETPR